MAELGVVELVEWVKGPATLSKFMARSLDQEVAEACRRHARKLHPRLHMAGLSARGAVLALWCDTGVGHVLAGMRSSGRAEFQADPEAWEQLVRLCSEQGRAWLERLLAAGEREHEAYPLLARLVADHGLAEPSWFKIARLGRPDGLGAGSDDQDQVLWYRHLLASLDALSQEEREKSIAAVVEVLTTHEARRPWWLGRWAVPLLIRIGATPEQVLWEVREYPLVDRSSRSPEYREAFLGAVAERGRDFAAEFVATAVLDEFTLQGGFDLVELLIVEHALPLPPPERRDFWKGWFWRAATPQPGRRWQEQFLAACAVRDVMPPFASPKERIAEVADALRELRAVEEVDEAALTNALIAVWERDDRPSSQHAAAHWCQALGLQEHLRGERSRLLAVLPVVAAPARTFVVDQLLAAELSDAELAELAVVVLPWGGKALTASVLEALRRLGTAPRALRESVEEVAQAADSRTADRALALLAGWG